MVHNHCSDESHSNEHDHNSGSDSGSRDNLFQYIDRSNVVALNAPSPSEDGPKVIKPWNERLDEAVAVMSDSDDQMIFRIPFTGSVKLRSLLLKTGPADHTPTKVVLYANEPSLDFGDIADKVPTQEFDVAQGREVGEYALKAFKFSNLASITLFFPGAQGADTTQIYYVGFLGTWTERKNNPVIAVYETQANLADHEKIQGTDGNFSSFRS